jgi:hypothetical protein
MILDGLILDGSWFVFEDQCLKKGKAPQSALDRVENSPVLADSVQYYTASMTHPCLAMSSRSVYSVFNLNASEKGG